jgi:hypothetical protein
MAARATMSFLGPLSQSDMSAPEWQLIRADRRDGHGTRGNPTLSPLTVGMWTTMTMTGGVDGASLKIGAKSFTEEALLAAITKIELGNLKYTVDFRSVYQTLIRDWLQGDPAAVLGASYPELPIIRAA